MTTKEQIASWRLQAERIRKLAEGFDPDIKNQLLKCADDYDKMAANAENSIAYGNGPK